MRGKPGWIIVAGVGFLLLLLLVGIPWYVAYKSFRSAAGYLGTENGREIQWAFVDTCYFSDRYKGAVWYEKKLAMMVKDDQILCNDKVIDFPKGKNVALVRGPKDVSFVALDDKYFKEESEGGGIWYIFGEVPHFRNRYKGMIDLEKVKNDVLIAKEWHDFLPGSP